MVMKIIKRYIGSGMELTETERYRLEKAYRQERDGKIKIRLLALICMYIDGKTVEETCRLLRLNEGAIRKYRASYRSGGIGEVRRTGHSSGTLPSERWSEEGSVRDRGEGIIPDIETGMCGSGKPVCREIHTECHDKTPETARLHVQETKNGPRKGRWRKTGGIPFGKAETAH
jgi:hypothetical protein